MITLYTVYFLWNWDITNIYVDENKFFYFEIFWIFFKKSGIKINVFDLYSFLTLKNNLFSRKSFILLERFIPLLKKGFLVS